MRTTLGMMLSVQAAVSVSQSFHTVGNTSPGEG